MSDGNSPEINVDHLVARIRQEVSLRRAESQGAATPPAPPYPGDAVGTSPALQEGLEAVEQHARIGTVVPDWPLWNGIKRRLGRLAARLVMRLSVFLTKEQREFNLDAVQLFREVASGLRRLDAGLRQSQAAVALLEDAHREGFDRLDRSVAHFGEDLHRLERFASESVARLDTDLASRNARTDDLERKLLRLQTNLLLQERRLERFFQEVRQRLPASSDGDQLRALAEETTRSFEGFYAGLEDQFRGTREDIKDRLRVYVPLVKEVGPGIVLDLGCGRGEWLELLREEGVPARGVDVNRPMLEQCRARGFDVVEADALTHLRGLPDASLAGVFGVHLIEHLPFESLMSLLDETVRVLRSGGLAIFETPNPANLLVGSCNFYQDPTHRRPIPSPLAQYIAEARGLCRVRILPLHPYPEGFRLRGTELAERFSEHFYGPQDYAVVGYRA